MFFFSLWQLLQSTWFQTYWLRLSFAPRQLDREGDSGSWANQSLLIRSPGQRMERQLRRVVRHEIKPGSVQLPVKSHG